MLPLFAAFMGAIIGGTIVGTVLVPEPPRTHYYDSSSHPANTENNQARQQRSLWVPQDSTGFFALWTALFTAVLAVSTTLLWSESNNASTATERQLELARAEYNSSHRPHLIVRDVFVEGGNIVYLLVNKGETPARIVESWTMAEFVPVGQPLRPLRSFGHDDLGQITLDAGEVRDITYSMPGPVSFAMMFPGSRRIGIEGRPPVHGETFFTGTIVYEDGNGHRRRTVFRRQWNQPPGSVGAFNRVGDPDQEYAD
jgi:hypothetical protein